LVSVCPLKSYHVVALVFGTSNNLATMGSNDPPLYSLLLLLTATILSLLVLSTIGTTYYSAYISAPVEITTFLDALDFSIQENESYDQDIARLSRLEDKVRLVRLLREIQRCGDDLREELNRLLIGGGESGTRLRSSARLFWASKRGGLEERVRRMDMLRMRFLVVFMGIIASNTGITGSGGNAGRDPEKMAAAVAREVPKMQLRPTLNHALTEAITGARKPPPLRRLTTQAMGHQNEVGSAPRSGWAGVIQELQKSPVMHKRHASIETAMSRPP
jgi:hypothetical protein